MGQVHAARHASGRRVVVKRLRDTLALDPRLIERLGDEGRVSRRISHPNVVRVFDHGVSADGTPFIVMEHAQGATLRKLILGQTSLPLARVRGLVAQLLDGIAAIHDAGIVHADIKSSNIIVDTVGGADHLTIIDFGLSRTRTSQITEEATVAGTPEYMAPEVSCGETPTIRADVYSAATVIYEMLVGVTPFGGPAPLEVLERQLSEQVVFPADVRASLSPALEYVLLRALAKDPTRRFPDARSFAAAFDEAIAPLAGLRPEPELVRRCRRALATVLEVGAAEPVIAAYLELAEALLADGRASAAAQELEGALAFLLSRRGEPTRSLWRLEAQLAALHDRLGNPIRARRAAMDAYDHARRHGCAAAEQHTGELLRRLMGGPRPTAPPGPSYGPASRPSANKPTTSRTR
jgi:hypothetical protein